MRWVLAWIGCALVLAAAACEDDSTPPAPAEPPPVATATAAHTAEATQAPTSAATPVPTTTPEPTPTAAPTSTPSATPRATPESRPTPTPEPEPTSTPSPAPEPTPSATPESQVIEFTTITRGEPRPMPAGLALYYWVYPCTACDAQPADYRRVVLDEAVGAVREDRPLAFFDASSDHEHYNPVRSFSVSASGQTLAATVCHAAFCEVEPVGGESGPSADTELRLWVSHDGGGTWGDWGQLLPQTGIIEVTDDDVLVGTSNIWRAREHWTWLTDEEWEAMLARLAPLGLDERERWVQRFRWVASGEVPDASVVGSARDEGGPLLAIPDRDGSVQHYTATDQRGGPSTVGDLLIRSRTLTGTGFGIEATTMELVDLATASIHEVEGLSLPFGLDIELANSQYEYYHFITARPAPAAKTARPAVEYIPLTLGDPRELPAGAALYFADWPYEGFATDVTLGFATGDGFVTERLWAVWDDSSAYVTSFQVSDDGRTMAAAVCEQGYCEDCYSGPTEDASLRLRVWRRSTFDWEDWGEIPQGSYIEGVTAQDVAITAWLPDPDSHDSRDHVARLWWFRSGQEVEPPAGLDPDGAEGWHWRSGGFLWDYGGDAYVTDSGTALLPPPDDASAPESARWYLDEVRGDGTALWSLYGADEQRFALVGEGGEVVAAFTWDDASEKLHLAGFVSDDLVVGQIVPRLWHTGTPDTEPPTTVLVDLANHSVHPVTDLDDVAIDDCLCLWFVRSQP